MTEPGNDGHRIPFDNLLDSKSRLFRLLVLVIIGLGLLLGSPHAPVVGQTDVAVDQTGTLAYASVGSTGALNLTNADVNASRSFLESSWSANSTTAQSRINSTDVQGETVSAIWRLDPALTAQAEIIKYDFTFVTQLPKPGSSSPNVTASVGLTSSDVGGWYAQSRTPTYSNKTETVRIVNLLGSYPNGSLRSSLLFETTQVTDAQAGNSTVLFQKEFPGYAGDAVPHQYTIEIDRMSNRTIWIVDSTVLATFMVSFTPSNMLFVASASGSGNAAVATLKGPVQTTVPFMVTILPVTSGNSAGTGNITVSTGQSSSIQNQIDHLKSQVGNLTSQNSQLQAKTSQWFAQWWAGLVWAVLGAGVGGVFFVTGTKLIARKKAADASIGQESACPQCGQQMPTGATFCGECGNSLRTTGLSCPGCGEQMPHSSLYCGECGAQITPEERLGQAGAQTSGEQDVKDGTWR